MAIEIKSKALDLALSQIEKQFGKGSIMKLGEQAISADIAVVPTGSLGLDVALGVGGLPRGRVVEIYGPESSGKTTLALECIAEAQKMGGTCAFIDAEHALDAAYARKLGVSVISSACSPLSGCEMSRSSTLTPSLRAYAASSACSASINAHVPPIFCASAIHSSARVVLPDDSGP